MKFPLLGVGEYERVQMEDIREGDITWKTGLMSSQGIKWVYLLDRMCNF